jgi:hypothetical protein
MFHNGVEDFHLSRGSTTQRNTRTGEVIYSGNDVSLGLYNGNGDSLNFKIRTMPSITVRDKDGFWATLGSEQLSRELTCESSQTSAASIILFNKNRRIIWRAP